MENNGEIFLSTKIFIFIKNTIETIYILIIKWFLIKERDIESKGNILLINTLYLGDLIVSLPLIIAFKNKYKNIDVYLLIDIKFSNLFKVLNLKLKLIEWNKFKFKYDVLYKIKLLKYLHSLGLEKAFNLSQERGILNDELTLFSGAKEKICFQKNAVYLIPIFEKINNRKYTRILNFQEINEYKKTYMIKKEICPELENQNELGNIFINDDSDFPFIKKPYIVISPLPNNKERTWGLDKFNILIQELSLNNTIVILGLKNQEKFIEDKIKTNYNIISFVGKTEISEAIYIIKNCSLFIGHDSGLTHIAKFFNIPLIALIGGGMYGRFFPIDVNDKTVYLFNQMNCFGCRWNCVHDKMYCLTEISVNEVLKASNKLLKWK